MLKEHAGRIGEDYWDRADLVVEVVSDDDEDRRRDLQTKRREYARAGIPEYWIVDPREACIEVLRLSGKRYVARGRFPRGAAATSLVLPEFAVDVSTALAHGAKKSSAGKAGRKRSQPNR
jgi:Uma2 family endonuclease